MFILEKNLVKCEICGKLRGTIEEKYNGIVPVQCKCDLRNKSKPWPNPACICIGREGTDDPRIIWRPISDSKDEKGQWGHNPYFQGPSVW